MHACAQRLVGFQCVLLPFLLVAIPAAESYELVVPAFEYRTGPYAPSGIPIWNGFSDYLTLLNERDGGIQGVKIKIPVCETGYDTKRGVECYEKVKKEALVILPGSTGIAYELIPKAAIDRIPILWTDSLDTRDRYRGVIPCRGRVFPAAVKALIGGFDQDEFPTFRTSSWYRCGLDSLSARREFSEKTRDLFEGRAFLDDASLHGGPMRAFATGANFLKEIGATPRKLIKSALHAIRNDAAGFYPNCGRRVGRLGHSSPVRLRLAKKHESEDGDRIDHSLPMSLGNGIDKPRSANWVRCSRCARKIDWNLAITDYGKRAVCAP
jgi:Periplasmic binding protein